MVRPPVNLAVLEDAGRKGIGRGGDAFRNRRGIVRHDAFMLEAKPVLVQSRKEKTR